MCQKSIVLFMVVALCGVVGARVWDDGGGDSSWCTPGNWNPHGLPSSGESADINCGSGYVATVDCNSAECNLFRLGETGGGTAEVVVAAGGILDITAFELSTSSGADITLTMNGGTINASTSNYHNFGRNGTGTFDLNSGAINIGSGSLFRFGRGDGATHTINMYTGFHLNCAGSESYIPESSTGTFNVYGGTFTGGSAYCTYGDTSNGTWNIMGGTINVTDLTCGKYGGTTGAELNFSGGTVNITGSLSGSHKGGALNVSGSADVNIENLNWPNYGGTYTMDMSGGTVDVNGNVTFGESYDTTCTVDISGGTFTANGQYFNIGNLTHSGTVTVTMTGGSVTCAAEPSISQYNNGTNQLIMQGGTFETLATYGFNIGTGGMIDVNGGVIIMGGDQRSEVAGYVAAGKIISSMASALPIATYDGGTNKTTLQAMVDPDMASNPNPADNAVGVALNPTLSWDAGASAADPDGHDVYFGTVSGALIAQGNQTATSFSPAVLAPSTEYFWRIDEQNTDSSVTTGNEWSFTTAASSCDEPPMDFDGDCVVTLFDFVEFAADFGDCGLTPQILCP